MIPDYVNVRLAWRLSFLIFITVRSTSNFNSEDFDWRSAAVCAWNLTLLNGEPVIMNAFYLYHIIPTLKTMEKFFFKKITGKERYQWYQEYLVNIIPSPARVAQWWASRTHDQVVVNSIPSWGDFFLSGVFSPFNSAEACEKSSRWLLFQRKVVLVLVWESQETHMRHRPPWYDPSC